MNISIVFHIKSCYTFLHYTCNYSKYLFTTLYNRGYPIIIHSKALSLTCNSSVYLIKVSPHFTIIYLHNIMYHYVARKQV